MNVFCTCVTFVYLYSAILDVTKYAEFQSYVYANNDSIPLVHGRFDNNIEKIIHKVHQT